MKRLRLVSAVTILVGALIWSAWEYPALADDLQSLGADEFQVQIGDVEHAVQDLPPVGTAGPNPGPTGVQGPDLVVDKVWMYSGCYDTTPENGSSLADGFQVAVTVRNAGKVKLTKPFEMRVRILELNDDGDRYTRSTALDAGAQFTYVPHFKSPPGFQSKVHVAVELDTKKEIAEMKEGNNTASGEFTNPCVQSFPGGG